MSCGGVQNTWHRQAPVRQCYGCHAVIVGQQRQLPALHLGNVAGQGAPTPSCQQGAFRPRNGPELQEWAHACPLSHVPILQSVACRENRVFVSTRYGSSSLAALVLCTQELRKWVDTSAENAHLLLHAKAEARAKRWAMSRGPERRLPSKRPGTGGCRTMTDSWIALGAKDGVPSELLLVLSRLV